MTPSALPRVVACLPAWRSEGFIEATLQSLAAQTYPNLQVLISDDASADRTAEICREFAAGRPQFEVHRQPRNLGWIGNANWLLRHADGEYLFFAYHDDPLEPTYVEELVEALEHAPGAVLAHADAVVDYRSGSESWVGTLRYTALEGLDTPRARLRVLTPREGDWWIPGRGLFRRTAAMRVGGLRRHLGSEVAADWPWLLSLSLLGSFVRVPRPLVRKVWTPQGLSRSWRWGSAQSLAVTLSSLREILRADLPLRTRMQLAGDFLDYWIVRWASWPFRRLARARITR